jgi:mRNA-degrading endonuclease YafQ of YafQ-DinJ toxin-antitoxin module
LRAISAGGDLRIIFMEENNYEVIHLIRIGTHNQVY